MPRLGGACAALCCVLLLASTAAADPLADAKAAVDNSDYFTARSALDEALRAGTHHPAQLGEIHRLRGIVAAALGDPDAATKSFEMALALVPTMSLPVGISPKISRPFDAAKEQLKNKQPLKIKTDTKSDPPSVTIEVVSDPASMIKKLRAVATVDGKPAKEFDKPVAPSVKIDLPKGSRIDLQVVALDDNGNHVAELGTKEVPIVIVGKGGTTTKVVKQPIKQPVVETPSSPRPLYLKWWLWGGAAVVGLGAAGFFGVEAVLAKNELDDLNAESPNHTFDEAKAVETRARHRVLFTNISLIAGGAFAITAGVLYLTRPGTPTTERRVSIAPLVHPSGGGVVIGGAF